MKIITGVFLSALVLLGVVDAHATSVFINEIHYDNAGTDIGEAVEIAGPAGVDLSGWSIVLYNGGNGTSYSTTSLAGTIPNQQNGFGTLYFAIAGIQNGSPDGLALVRPASVVEQFLSYEGAFTAVGGPANGMTSVDIGMAEDSVTTVGYSLQLSSAGQYYEDFVWAGPVSNTFGAVNAGQRFVASTPVPEPSTMLLLAGGMVGLAAWRRLRR